MHDSLYYVIKNNIIIEHEREYIIDNPPHLCNSTVINQCRKSCPFSC